MRLVWDDLPDGYEVGCNAFAAAVAPPPRVKVWEWADAHRILSAKETPEPGQWRTGRVPYSREIMECLSPQHPCSRVTFMKSVQTVGTESALNWIGWFMDTQQGPMMIVQPTLHVRDRFTKQRLRPMIEECPTLLAKVGAAKSRDGSNTLDTIEGPGFVLILAGANSAASLRSAPALYLVLDEEDAYEHDVDDEGDPADLAEARTSNFPRAKIFEISTPTIESLSRINKSFQRSDQRRYHIPCPHCLKREEEHLGLQSLVWEQLHWPKGQPDKAEYQCVHCAGWIREYHKAEFLLEAGFGGHARWIPEHPGPHRHPGFHINGLYAPIGLGWSWAKLAARWDEISGDPVRRKTFENTRLGQCSKDPNEKLDHHELMLRAGGYAMGTVPNGFYFLTGNVDVQKDRLVMMKLAHGRNRAVAFCDYVEVYGDPTDSAWFDQTVDEYMAEPLPNVHGVAIRVSAYAVDSGYLTDDVLHHTNKRRGRCIATKGASQPGKPIIAGKPSKTEFNWPKTSTITYGAEIWIIGGDTANDHLFSRLRTDREKAPDQRMVRFPGFVNPDHPDDPQMVEGGFDEQFFLMLTAEVYDPNKGKWVRERKRNESIDCFRGAMAAAMQPRWHIHKRGEAWWKAQEMKFEPPIDLFTVMEQPTLAESPRSVVPEAKPITLADILRARTGGA